MAPILRENRHEYLFLDIICTSSFPVGKLFGTDKYTRTNIRAHIRGFTYF